MNFKELLSKFSKKKSNTEDLEFEELDLEFEELGLDENSTIEENIEDIDNELDLDEKKSFLEKINSFKKEDIVKYKKIIIISSVLLLSFLGILIGKPYIEEFINKQMNKDIKYTPPIKKHEEEISLKPKEVIIKDPLLEQVTDKKQDIEISLKPKEVIIKDPLLEQVTDKEILINNIKIDEELENIKTDTKEVVDLEISKPKIEKKLKSEVEVLKEIEKEAIKIEKDIINTELSDNKYLEYSLGIVNQKTDLTNIDPYSLVHEDLTKLNQLEKLLERRQEYMSRMANYLNQRKEYMETLAAFEEITGKEKKQELNVSAIKDEINNNNIAVINQLKMQISQLENKIEEVKTTNMQPIINEEDIVNNINENILSKNNEEELLNKELTNNLKNVNIFKMGGELIAVAVADNGKEMIFKRNDIFGSGFKILDIEEKTIIFEKNKNIYYHSIQTGFDKDQFVKINIPLPNMNEEILNYEEKALNKEMNEQTAEEYKTIEQRRLEYSNQLLNKRL